MDSQYSHPSSHPPTGLPPSVSSRNNTLATLWERWKHFRQTPDGREWQWYGALFLGFLGFLLVMLILFDVWIMPRYVGLDKVVNVPNVVGMTQLRAFQYLREQGLQPVMRGQYFSNTVPAGYITAQLPYPASEVKPERRIYLDVSKGKQTIEVPRLVGLTLREAKLALLRAEGLQVGRVTYNYNDNLQPDYIYAQSIPMGTKVTVGTQIDVSVSLGARDVYVVMPDLIGKSVDEAQILISSLGLILSSTSKAERTELNETLRPGTIISQVPQKGDSVRSGTPVTLTVTR